MNDLLEDVCIIMTHGVTTPPGVMHPKPLGMQVPVCSDETA